MTMKVKTEYTIRTLAKEHMQSTAELFIKSFCDSEPITKYLGIQYEEYEPFVIEVITKAVKEGISVVAVDKNNRVIACTIAEDITNQFTPNLSLYPKMKPVFALLDKLSEPFLENKIFKKGKIAHVWVAIVDADYRGKGLSTEIDLACGAMCVSKGYEFAYAEFTNAVSEKITHHYKVHKLFNTIKYDTFTWNNQKPFASVEGEATAYIVGLRPGVTLDVLKDCYTIDK